MFRKLLTLLFFCFVAQQIFALDSINTAADAYKHCHAKHPEVPEEVMNNVTNKTVLYKAGRDNVPGVQCFIGCLMKVLIPTVVEEDGKINPMMLSGIFFNKTVKI